MSNNKKKHIKKYPAIDAQVVQQLHIKITETNTVAEELTVTIITFATIKNIIQYYYLYLLIPLFQCWPSTQNCSSKKCEHYGGYSGMR